MRKIFWNVISEKVLWSKGYFTFPIIVEWEDEKGPTGIALAADKTWTGIGDWEGCGGSFDSIDFTTLGRILDHLNKR